MAIISVVLLMFAGITLVAALAVRFSGNDSILSGIDTQNISDMAAANQYAGNRLLLVPLVAFPFGFIGIKTPIIGFIGGFVVALAFIGVFAWIAIGVEKFKNVG